MTRDEKGHLVAILMCMIPLSAGQPLGTWEFRILVAGIFVNALFFVYGDRDDQG